MTTSADITIDSLITAVDRGEPILLLDVRNEEEFQQWKIEGRHPVEAVHVPYFDFIEDDAAATAKVPAHSGELIVVCAKGGSSAMVAEVLRDAGIPARNLEGGMVAYGEYLQPVEVPLDTASQGKFRLWQVNRRGKGCLSYVLVSGGEAAVFDPSRNLAVYESIVAAAAARITHVFETHVHADHVSGGHELASRHGAHYAVSAGPGFAMELAAEGLTSGSVALGNTAIEVLQAPGHTPGSICYGIAGRYLLSGDTVFINAVGRPDLGGHVVEWAGQLYHTLKETLGRLSADTTVLPAHYAGIREIGKDGVVSALLGDLRNRLPEFQAGSEREFVAAMVRAVKTPPEAYASIIRTNLGSEHPDAAHMTEWELGKNECAAGGAH